ncbi:MAG: hypothetical protein ABSF88_06295 [Candidatus Aminicenantales bacterium]|jgi:hypothetical protein
MLQKKAGQWRTREKGTRRHKVNPGLNHFAGCMVSLVMKPQAFDSSSPARGLEKHLVF